MRRALRLGVTLACLGTMLLALATLFAPTLLGYKRYVITGGSMTGTIPKGSVIYSKLAPVEALRVGDVITFVPPEMDAPVTHRITAIEPDERGNLVFTTKGDYNPSEDPWSLRFVDPVQARYAFHIPYLGYALAYLAVRQVRMLLIGLPAVVIALSMLVSLWREAGRELEQAEGRRDGAVGQGPLPSDALPEAALHDVAPPARRDPFAGASDAELSTLRGWW
ncbi:MAG: signal peptidase I [Thermoleophilia bacterium]|nr:signal peptidase I [Thermoleophilia bacterium]